MTLERLMSLAALECVEERERHLAIFTVGMNGYVCKNEIDVDESRALFKGTYRDCQVWIERRGIGAALRCIIEQMSEVPELAIGTKTPAELLALLARDPQ
jgi:hypothetical protein